MTELKMVIKLWPCLLLLLILLIGGGKLLSQDAAIFSERSSNDEEPTYSGPIIITRGGTYSGNWESVDPNTPAVTIRTSQPVVISNANIRSKGTLIHTHWGYNANLTVRNVKGYGLNPDVAGRIPGRFLIADTYSRVLVENSYLEGTSGIWLHASKEGATVKILRNRVKNIDGRKSDGNGGFTSDFALVQFVQFDKGRRLVDSEVAWNMVVNEPYQSRVEDVISLFQTTGTASSPVKVHNNYIQGAYPVDPARDSFSGGGIILGDEGGAYLHAFDNHVVSTSNYGIAIAGGTNNKIYNNRVISCGYLADGTYIASQNVGIYIWNNSRRYDFSNNIGYGNYSGWSKAQYTWSGGRNDWWIPDANSWSNNKNYSPNNSAVACATEKQELKIWQNKVARADIHVGPYEK